MIYTFSTTRSRAAPWLPLQRVFLCVGAEMAEGGIATPEDNAEDGVAKQLMLGEPPEVVVVHVWRGLHCIGDAVDISSAGLRALEGGNAFATSVAGKRRRVLGARTTTYLSMITTGSNNEL